MEGTTHYGGDGKDLHVLILSENPKNPHTNNRIILLLSYFPSLVKGISDRLNILLAVGAQNKSNAIIGVGKKKKPPSSFGNLGDLCCGFTWLVEGNSFQNHADSG